MSNVIPFPAEWTGAHVGIHRYEGGTEDRFLVVLIEPDGRWLPRSGYLQLPAAAETIARDVAEEVGVRAILAPVRAGTWEGA